jgi:hypothetical protein
MLGRQNAGRAVRVVLAGGLMLAAVWWARGVFLPIPVAIGVLTYGTAVIMLGVVSPEQRDMFRRLALRTAKRLGVAPAAGG